MELFSEHGFNPRTDLGQNFLIDLNLVEYIVEQAQLQPGDVVLEIGAGTGGMTTFLAQQADAVISVEIDRNMYGLAQQAVAELENVTLVNCDALKNKNHLNPEVMALVQEKLAEDPQRKLKLVANLPYNVATPVISNLVADEFPWWRMIVTIQFELGLRMIAKPSTSHYGALSVWLQSQAYVKILKKLGPTVFWPRPKVNSAIVRLVPNPERKRTIADRAFLQDFIRRLFHQRRKHLRRVLVGMYRKQLEKPAIDAMLLEHRLAESARAEELSVTQLILLANDFQRLISADEQ